MQEVHDQLFGGNNLLMLVNGQGGIGKTTFAAKYWLKYEDEYTHLGILYVGNGIGNALTSGEFTNNLGIVFPEKNTEEENLQIVFEHIRRLSKPCLLVLDNANDAEDLGKYAVDLGKCLNCHILLTSRLENFANTHKYSLGALDKVAALQVFQQNYQYYRATDEVLFYEIFEAVGGNTLLMELLAKNLNNFNRHKPNYSLQKLYNDLQKSLLKLSKSKEVATAYQAQGTGFRNEKPEVIILAMYDLSELTEVETALLSAFAVLPPENIAFESLATLLKSTTLENCLEKLSNKGWIEFDKTTQSYKISPVVQAITRYKNKNRLFGDCKKMMSVLADELNWLDNPNYHQENYQQTTLYNHYAESIVNIFVTPNKLIGILCEGIGKFYTTIGKLNKALEFYENDFETAEYLTKQNPTDPDYKYNLAVSYQNLGNAHSILGKFYKALNFFVESNNLCEELCRNYPQNEEYKHGLVCSYLYLGDIHNRLDNLEQALHYFEEFHLVAQKLCGVYPKKVKYKNNLVVSYQYLGRTYMLLDNLDKALEFYIKSKQLSQELSTADPTDVLFKYNSLASSQNLGTTYRLLGNLEQASTHLTASHQLAQELYAAYPTNVIFKHGLAASYWQLGDLYRAKSKKEKILLFFPSFKAWRYKRKAKNYYLESKKHYVELVKISPDNKDFQDNLKTVEERLNLTRS